MSQPKPFSRAATVAARLRPMLPGDLAAVLALEHELFPDDAWTAEMFADEVSQPADSRLYLVVEQEPVRNLVTDLPSAAGTAGRGGAQAPRAGLAGYAGMMFVPGARGRGGTADVLTIAVSEVNWGQGIGSALLAALINEARRRRCDEVFLEVRKDNPRARGLYSRRGFEEIGVRRGYYQPANVDAIVMRKDLHTS